MIYFTWFRGLLCLLVILFYFVYWKQGKEPYGFLEEKNTLALLETPRKTEEPREPPMGLQSQASSPRRREEKPEEQESLEQSSLMQPSQEWIPDKQETPDQLTLGQPSQTQVVQEEQTGQQIPWKWNVSYIVKDSSQKLEKIIRQMKIKFIHIMLQRYGSRVLKVWISCFGGHLKSD